MSSPTTSPPTVASTSTPGIETSSGAVGGADQPQLSRVPLRRVGGTLTGVRASTAQATTLIDGTLAAVAAGDWLIYQGSVLVAVVLAKDFPAPYEILVEGRLVLSKTDREGLEAVAGIGCTRTPTDLLHAVERLARIRIGDVTIPFTPGQLEEIAQRAQKRSQTVAQTVGAIVDRIKEEIFWGGAPR
jgi:hypothetical protein